MLRSTLLPVFLGILVLAGTTEGATYYVPDNYATIQAAINASANGDVIIVRPGTYMENLDFSGKEVTVSGTILPHPGRAAVSTAGQALRRLFRAM